MSLPLQFIWDYVQLPNCQKVPESEISLEQVRKSCGIESDPETGSRSYFVPLKDSNKIIDPAIEEPVDEKTTTEDSTTMEE